MENVTPRGRSALRLLIIGVLAVVVLVAGMCAIYVGALKTNMEEENDRYLGEISQHVAAMVNYKIQTAFQALHSTAETYPQFSDREESYRYLTMMAQQYGFLRLGIVDRNGNIVTTDGYSQYVGDVDIVGRALSGESAVSGIVPSPLDGVRAIIYMVPIYMKGELAGALAATASMDQMRELLSVKSFGGAGFSHIIDGAGNFIVGSENPNSATGLDNFFRVLETRCRLEKGYSLAAVREDMASGRPGMLYFSVDDLGERSMCYVKLEAEDWYLLSVVPTVVAGERTQLFIRLSVVINSVVVALFIALTLLLVHVYRKSQRDLEQMAFVDSVTQGMNRLCFEREAAAAIQSAPPGTWALVDLDIQRFKLINDAFGSKDGNRTLHYFYEVFHRELGQGELLARLSGDNFNILLKNRPQEELTAWLERTTGGLNAFNQTLTRKYYLPVTAGVYVVDEPELDIITIQDRANVARKNNKTVPAGRLLGCAFYSDVERIRLLREKEIADKRESALENGEFVIYLQPKIDLDSGAVSGAEALVRWQDPERGLVAPDEFIPSFERDGFITRIDLFVFSEVCKLLRRWLDEGVRPVPISVNLSRAHLSVPDALRPFQEVHARYGVPAGLIEFEFTETMAYEDMGALVELIRQIHAAGFHCALDDFGSGYSSLNTLKEVPADVLKLDRVFFIGAAADDDRGRYVVESILALARQLNMKTVSEGVETLQQVEFLRRVKCDMVQGFVFSRPLPVPEFERAQAEAERARLVLHRTEEGGTEQ